VWVGTNAVPEARGVGWGLGGRRSHHYIATSLHRYIATSTSGSTHFYQYNNYICSFFTL